MEDKYYVYNGTSKDSDDGAFWQNILNTKRKIEGFLSDDEKLELLIDFPKTRRSKNHNIIVKYCILPRWNLNINLKASTIALIALILDIEVTNGIASFILAATGVDMRLITKLDEEMGEKCVLVEVYKKENHKAKSNILNQIYGKECINNDMNCKFRVQGICTIEQENVKEILDDLNNKNVLTKKNDFYKYNF